MSWSLLCQNTLHAQSTSMKTRRGTKNVCESLDFSLVILQILHSISYFLIVSSLVFSAVGLYT